MIEEHVAGVVCTSPTLTIGNVDLAGARRRSPPSMARRLPASAIDCVTARVNDGTAGHERAEISLKCAKTGRSAGLIEDVVGGDDIADASVADVGERDLIRNVRIDHRAAGRSEGSVSGYADRDAPDAGRVGGELEGLLLRLRHVHLVVVGVDLAAAGIEDRQCRAPAAVERADERRQ